MSEFSERLLQAIDEASEREEHPQDAADSVWEAMKDGDGFDDEDYPALARRGLLQLIYESRSRLNAALRAGENRQAPVLQESVVPDSQKVRVVPQPKVLIGESASLAEVHAEQYEQYFRHRIGGEWLGSLTRGRAAALLARVRGEIAGKNFERFLLEGVLRAIPEGDEVTVRDAVGGAKLKRIFEVACRRAYAAGA